MQIDQDNVPTLESLIGLKVTETNTTVEGEISEDDLEMICKLHDIHYRIKWPGYMFTADYKPNRYNINIDYMTKRITSITMG